MALGNFFCIRKKQGDPEAKMEMAVTAAEKEGLNCRVEGEEVDEGEEEPKGKENGKASALKTGQEIMVGEEGGEENTET